MCWSRAIQLVCIVVAIFTVVIVSLIAVIFVWPSYVGQQMIEDQLFKNGSIGMNRFLNFTEDRIQEVHFEFFNITNSNEFMNAKGRLRLRLQQVGPFIFRKIDSIELLENNQEKGLITYKLRRRFIFDERRSKGNIKKLQVTWLNVPVLGLMGFIDRNRRTSYVNEANFLSIQLQNSLNSVGEKPFISDTMESFLFAGSFRLFSKHLREAFQRDFEKKFNWNWPIPDYKFGFYYRVNNTWNPSRDYQLTVMTGHGLGQDYNNLNQFRFMNNSEKLLAWNDIISDCNQVGGTDGRFFKPYLESSDKLTVYLPDICRKVALKYRNTETIDGIPTYRYTMDERSFMSPARNKENVCYCVDNDGIRANCELDGIVNMAGCNLADNVFASAPNFFGGSGSLSNGLDGLSRPDANLDEPLTYSIEPYTGLPVRSRVALQFNIKLVNYSKNWTQFNWLQNSEVRFVPLLRVTETTVMTEWLKSSLNTSDLKYISIVIVSAVTLSLIVFLIILSIGVSTTKKLSKSTSARNSRRLSAASVDSRPNKMTLSASRRSSDSGFDRKSFKEMSAKKGPISIKY